MERQILPVGAHRQTILSAVVPAFGAATLSMLPILGALVSPTHDDVYHLVGPASALFVPALFNLFLLTFAIALLLLLFRPDTRFGVLVWSACFFSMPWVALKSVTTLYELRLPHAVSLGVFGLGISCMLLSAALWKPQRTAGYARGLSIFKSLLGLVAVLGLILTLQTCWCFYQARHLNDPAAGVPSAFAPKTEAPAKHPLVLWILFDELSQDQVYDSRYPGLALPNLDSFAAQSNVFTHVIPAGNYTEKVLLGLMSPIHGEHIRASANGLAVQLRDSGDAVHAPAWKTFDQRQTVFSDAQALGYRPAVVGWYNPYCRILPTVLTSCFWTNQSELSAFFPARTIHENLFQPAARLLRDIPRFFFPHRFHNADPSIEAHLHIDDYVTLRRAADATLSDPSLDFVFVHMPIPHPNGIYDRHTGQLTTGPSTYIDNLALVDFYLGHVRQILQQRGAWDSATVIVMGDHSWRTKLLWVHDPSWSREEQIASHGGKFDDRPFYAVKLPNQTSSAKIDAPFPALNTKPLLDELLRHNIPNSDRLAQWTQAAH